MPILNTAPTFFTDADGFLHFPNQPPIKWVVTPNAGNGTQVQMQALVKDLDGNQRTLAENLEDA